MALLSPLFSCPLEDEMIRSGLVDIITADSTIMVDIYNATTQNMLGENTYGCLTKCFLRPETAEKLKKAQRILQGLKPGYSLKVLEGTRPRSVQKKMFAVVKSTSIKAYVANPATGSMHNYGTAVDLTIADETGVELDMGKPDPRIKVIGKSDAEIKKLFLAKGPNAAQEQNRTTLKMIMLQAGFIPLHHEWWHFEAFGKKYVREHFRIIE